MLQDDFEVTYEIEDGYVGGSRPQHFSIGTGDFDEAASEDELSKMFWEMINEDMLQKVNAVSNQEQEFIEWAKARQAEMKAEQD